MPFHYLVINDPHLDVKAPSSRRLDDYQEACFAKLDQVLKVVQAEPIRAVVCTGDWFHKKAPTAVPYALVRRLLVWMDKLDDAGAALLSVAGNHDVQYNDTSQATLEKQPYGILMAHPNFNQLSLYDPLVFPASSTSPRVIFTGCNYQKPVLVDGVPQEPMEQFASVLLKDRPEDVHVHVVHAAVVPKAPIWAPYTLADAALAHTHADILHCGHIHDDLGGHGALNRLGNPAFFLNHGSMTRGSLTEENAARIPKMLLVEVDGHRPRFEEIPFQCAPAEAIYDLQEYRERKTKSTQLSEWGEQLRRELAAQETTGTEKTLLQLVDETDQLDHGSRTLARHILNEVGE
jgi:DNA repair exonuclease SbcCD nuclease subunit